MEDNTKPIKILSVDDEPDMEDLLLQKFRREIRKGVYEFHFARNGAEALEKLKEVKDIDFILSDINMPVMDGLTLLSHVQAMNNPLLKTVMVTAYGDMDNIRVAMNNGAFDFLNKPINFEDLEITMKKTIEQVAGLRKSMSEHEQLLSIRKDLDVAKNIQLSLIPRIFPPFPDRKEIELFATMDAAKTIGGDFYDFYFIEQNKLGFVVGDVAGKGVPGAIFMALARTIIRTIAMKGLSPEKCMEESNELIYKESVDSMFVTVFYAVLDTVTGNIEYCNAGHTIPYILRNTGFAEKVPVTGDIVLGIMEGMVFHKKNITLAKGEELFVYSDGLTDAMDLNDTLFSEKRVAQNLPALHGKPIEMINREIVQMVVDYSKGTEQHDDITTLCLRFIGK